MLLAAEPSLRGYLISMHLSVRLFIFNPFTYSSRILHQARLSKEALELAAAWLLA